MSRRIRGRMTYANVAASLALFIAVATGGAYAHGLIHTNDLANDAVTAAKIDKDAVGSQQLAILIKRSKAVTVPAATGQDAGEAAATAKCKSGEQAISGGVTFGSGADQHQQIINSFLTNPLTWYGKGANYFSDSVTMTVRVNCLKVA